LFPPLLLFKELQGPLRTLVHGLDQFGRSAPSDAIASLYCHLAHWPPYLGIVHTALSPLHKGGALQAEQTRILGRAKEQAEELLLPRMSAGPLPDSDGAHRICHALETFTELMIARMLVMGTIMLELMPLKG
jgi:hypothetical protein